MLTLGAENGAMCVDRLALNKEDHIRKGWVIDDLPHIGDQKINSFVINLILFQLANIEYTNVIEPLAAVETPKNE